MHTLVRHLEHLFGVWSTGQDDSGTEEKGRDDMLWVAVAASQVMATPGSNHSRVGFSEGIARSCAGT